MAKIAKLQKEVDGVLNTIYPSTITEAVINIESGKNVKEELVAINSKIPTKTSDITNDSGYITKDVSDLTNYSTTDTVNQAINNAVSSKVDISSISTVATSGDYNDLNNKPVIPSSTSELTNDSNYITSSEVDTKINSAVTAVYKVRGSVDNYESLPISNVVVGDVYNLLDTGSNYVCISIDPIIWDKLSETIDLSAYSTTEENDAKYQLKGDYITSIPDEYVTDTELEAKGYATATSVEAALATKLDSSAYTAATSTTSGYMSSKDYIKLSGIEENANVNIIEAITVNGDAVSVTDKTAAIEVKEYTHPKFTKHDAGLYKITVNDEGHASNATVVTKDDITALGIPAQDTVYTHPSYVPREAGLYKVTVDSTGHVSNAAVVAKSDITSLGIPAQDTVYTHPSYTPHSEGLYKITVNELGHVSGVGAVTKDDITGLGIPAQDTVYDDSSLANRVSSLESGKVEKIDGKGLSTNDFTNEYKTKLDNADEVCVSAGVPPTGTQEVWIDTSDQSLDQTLLTDAPSNGKQYVRRDGAWVEWYDNQSIVPTRLSVVTSLESLPIDYYSIKATVSAATTMSFAATPMEGMEFMIDVLNSSTGDIEQALPNADGWQSNEETVTLVAGAVTPISVRYIHGIYCIRV